MNNKIISVNTTPLGIDASFFSGDTMNRLIAYMKLALSDKNIVSEKSPAVLREMILIADRNTLKLALLAGDDAWYIRAMHGADRHVIRRMLDTANPAQIGHMLDVATDREIKLMFDVADPDLIKSMFLVASKNKLQEMLAVAINYTVKMQMAYPDPSLAPDNNLQEWLRKNVPDTRAHLQSTNIAYSARINKYIDNESNDNLTRYLGSLTLTQLERILLAVDDDRLLRILTISEGSVLGKIMGMYASHEGVNDKITNAIAETTDEIRQQILAKISALAHS